MRLNRGAFVLFGASLVCSCTISVNGLALFGTQVWVEETEFHQISLEGIETLSLNTSSGSLVVSGADSNAKVITVTLTKRAGGRNDAEAKEALAALQVKRVQNGTTQQLSMDWKGVRKSHWQGSMDFTVKLPRSIAVQAETGYGRIKISDIAKAVEANTESGSVEVSGIGGRCDLESGYGNIVIADVAGELKARTGSGSIQAEDLKSDCTLKSGYGKISVHDAAGKVTAETDSGGITVNDVGGKCVLRSGYGNITVDDARDELEVVTSSGNIDVQDAHKNALLESGYGRITLQDVQGEVVAQTESGSIDAEDLKSNATFKSGYGKINVRGMRGDLSAVSGSGSLVIEAVTSRIELRSGYGSIEANLRGSTTIDGEIKTSTGNVRLILGPQASTMIECNTDSGNIKATGVKLYDTNLDKNVLKAKLGDGTGQLKVSTGYGWIQLSE